MIDTNQVQQAADVARDIAGQMKTNWPAISIAAIWLARELGNFNRWVRNVAEFIISHGGIGWLIGKLIWNPPGATAGNDTDEIAAALDAAVKRNSVGTVPPETIRAAYQKEIVGMLNQLK